MKTAIIGTGISGLTAAYLLHRDHDITVFEANDYIGGHTHTVPAQTPEGIFPVDTGFIVFNETTYPNFCKLLSRLQIPSQPTTMTLSVKCERTNLEWSPHTFNTTFAQRRLLMDISHWRMMWEIVRFRKQFPELIRIEHDDETLVGYLRRKGFSERFIDYFIIPMGSSLWSAAPEFFERFPLRTFVRFFHNHGIFESPHPLQWKVITGGSKQYVDALIRPFAQQIRPSCPVQRVRRLPDGVEVVTRDQTMQFDHVIIATHSDQALAMIEKPTPLEQEILGAIPYQENTVTLHTDTTILPERKWVWASWNYLIPRQVQHRVAVTYDMNILQGIQSSREFCVTLNRPDAVHPAQVIGTYRYEHPIYTTQAPGAQKRHAEISGVDRIHYCGAYWGYGFHEDGVRSALEVCKRFGKGL
jgi:predicted NAD/FAD-binding protein